jgi:hypothetical protein
MSCRRRSPGGRRGGAAMGLIAGLWVAGCVVPGDSPFGPRDDEPPRIDWTIPVDGVSGVPVDVRPEVRFSESMDWAAFTEDRVRLESGAVVAGVTLDFGRIGQHVIGVVPAGPLVPDVQWTLTISGEVEDAAFNPLGEDVAIVFRTAAAPDPFVLEASDPADGAEAVPVDAAIRLELSVPVAEPSVIRANFRLRTGEGGAVGYALEREEDGFVVVLTPTRDLDPDAAYVVTVDAATAAITGQRLGEDGVVSFTTEAD